jgi:aspartyl-tRNA(Asn)/glutamyl-tRNA(Gln) amidotransferase subunit C
MTLYHPKFKGVPMSDAISEEIFNHLVDLAALELEQAESRYLLTEMNKQIKAIQELEQIPLNQATPPARHGVPFSTSICPPLREDEVDMYPHVDDLLGQVPDAEDRYIIVPDIPHTELE